MQYSKTLIGVLTLLGVTTAHADDTLKWNGFINLAGGMLKDKPVSDRTSAAQYPGYKSYETRFTGMEDSLFALQVSKSLNDKLSITGQLVAHGSQDAFQTKVSWAYVSYQIDNNSSLRAGRLGSPNFYFSDFIDVGTAYYWVTPPYEVYDFGTSYQGLDYLRHDTIGALELSTEVHVGAGDNNVARPDGTSTATKTRDEFGVTFIGNAFDWLTSGVRYATTHASADSNVELPDIIADAGYSAINFENEKVEYTELFIKADFDRLFFLSEGTKVNIHAPMDVWMRRWYAMAGVRAGNATYHFTYGRSEDDLSNYDQQFTGIDQLAIKSINEGAARDNESYTLGVRIDTTRSTALKFDLMQFKEFASRTEETSGVGKNMLLRAAFCASF